MLKIKDNVSLEELEKYGFKKDEELTNYMETIYSVIQEYQKLCICWEDKILYLYEPFNSNTFFLKHKTLIDLIKDDVIVEEDNEKNIN